MVVGVFADNVQVTLNALWVSFAMRRFVNLWIAVSMMTARSLQVAWIPFVCRLNAGPDYRVQMASCVAISSANQPIVVDKTPIAKTASFVRMASVYHG